MRDAHPVEAGALAAESAALYTWLLQRAWPLWLDRGVDRARGGFFETLDLRTHLCAAPFRRLRVVARQIFVFSQAHAAGVPGAAQAVQMGLDFLQNHAAQGQGGYAWRFDLNHNAIDARRDLYDHAFVLLAFASAAKVAGPAAVRGPALALLAWIQAEFAHPCGGYRESLPPCLPRRQNPHMHLLEAALAAHAAFGDPQFLSAARALVTLFADRLFHPNSGALPEFFDETLQPACQGGIFRIEPGHHCEWVWLLHQAQAAGIADARLPAISEQLMKFVYIHGKNTDGFVMDAAGSDGRAISSAARLWPQTECLRAEFCRPAGARLASVRALAAYLRPDGLWHERRFADGRFSEEAAPASSLYHLTGAILSVKEALRF